METTRNIVIEFRLTREKALLILTFLFLAWHPGTLDSETLTLTTYYPAPYGGYASLLTTGNTFLARDNQTNGNPSTVSIGANTNPTAQKLTVVGAIKWGSSASKGILSSDQGASLELGGLGTPYIDFAQGAEDFSARVILSQASRLRVETADPTNGGLEIQGKMYNVCFTTGYGLGWGTCPGTTRVVGFRGDGVTRQVGYLPVSPTLGAGAEPGAIGLGGDWGGTMICCNLW
ncbi:MAG: hypothetical protein WCK76_05845 [Elusimicrobiota bacterium]